LVSVSVLMKLIADDQFSPALKGVSGHPGARFWRAVKARADARMIHRVGPEKILALGPMIKNVPQNSGRERDFLIRAKIQLKLWLGTLMVVVATLLFAAMHYILPTEHG
jgi:hypothetical protein